MSRAIVTMPHRLRGVTLVELMIALVIGLILTAGATQIFLGSKETYRTSEALSRVQENGRMALQLLAREIRQADYFGCQDNLTSVFSQLNTTAGFDPLGDGGLDVSDDTGPNDTDSITLRSVKADDDLYLTNQPSGNAETLTMNEPRAVAQGDIMIITDCRSADMFQVTNDPINNNSDQVNHNSGGSHDPGNQNVDLSRTYGPGTTALTFRQVQYDINQADGRFFLRRQVNQNTSNSSSENIIPGVVDFQLTYGVDSGGDAVVDYYVSGAGMSELDEDEIIAVRIDMVVQSEETNVTTGVGGAQEFTLADGSADGKTVTIDDGRLAQRFTGTYTIRNRVR
jgi:type IV pilus assembly protein PilW